jgi:hypothetical protein
MKKTLLISLLTLCLPAMLAAQTDDDDLYFVPKKKKEVKTTQVVTTVRPTTETVVVQPTVVVKDVKGNVRDVDEYNRRYTSRENTFSVDNDTLYIEEKPLDEQGEWVNGFEGSQDDYEYAMRIVRFRNPRYAIPVSSPLYWDVVYGLYPSWDWNVYDDGLYAYVFPTYTNRLWWDWRWDSFGWGWRSPWYYSSWYGPSYWGGYWGASWAWGGFGWGGHYHWGDFGWGGHWGGHGWNTPGVNVPGRFAGSGRFNQVASRGGMTRGGQINMNRGGRTSMGGNRSMIGSRSMMGGNRSTVGGSRATMGGSRSTMDRNRSTIGGSRSTVGSSRATVGSSRATVQGRVVNGRDNGTSVRGTQGVGSRAGNSYSRSTDRGNTSTYTRPSSTRTSVNNASNGGESSRGTYRESGSSRSSSRSNATTRSNSSSSRNSYNSSSSRNSSSGRSSGFSSGGSSSSRGGGISGGGGASHSSGGGGGHSRGR